MTIQTKEEKRRGGEPTTNEKSDVSTGRSRKEKTGTLTSSRDLEP